MATVKANQLICTPYESYTAAVVAFNKGDHDKARRFARSLLAWAKTEWTPKQLSHGRLAITVEIERLSRERINASEGVQV